jgi:hypothetical protein
MSLPEPFGDSRFAALVYCIRITSFVRSHTFYDSFNSFKSIVAYVNVFIALPTPGIIAIKSLRLPIFLICCNWSKKSWKSNWFLRIFFSSLLAPPRRIVPALFLPM